MSPALLELRDNDKARRWALSGGDDYELCFTVPESHMAEVGLLIARGELRATVVGHMVTGVGVQCLLQDRKSTRLNSSHVAISYAVCCLKTRNERTSVVRSDLS